MGYGGEEMTCLHPGCTDEPFSEAAQYCSLHRASVYVARRRRELEREGGVTTKVCPTCEKAFVITAPNQRYCAEHRPCPIRKRAARPSKRPWRRPEAEKYAPVVIPHPPHVRAINRLLREWR